MEARQLLTRCIRSCILIEVSELVDPHEVEGIAQLPASRVRRVVTEGEGLTVIDHEARRRRSGCIGVAVRLRRLCVHLRQELLDRLRDRIGPAERTDDAPLRERVALLVCLPLPDARHAGRLRPVARVSPVRVLVQDVVGWKKRRIEKPEERCDVRAVRWPVHETRRLEGGVVEVVDADLLRDLPRDGLILVRCDLTVQRQDQTETRTRFRVLVRGVDRHRTAKVYFIHEMRPEICRREVKVERQDLTRHDAAGLSVAIL